ncbi:HD domain-containing protein [Acetonema longum]|uniref:Ppx/GppA phosphatase n=1 Tax=Acetonema longum DSM 6540 TaxID=1009370 RepID=F7NIW9_9FIRM|nr:HD domain-containing protein [Acetonema longum]EGO63966.1 Ppx/GppA phosphatase [Acetonema longum DSM 6540]
MRRPTRDKNYFAAIHVGSEQVTIQLVEYQSLQDLKLIDRATYTVALGEETFKTGTISFAAVREICELLKGYRRMMNEYGVKDYRLLATTALREATNQQYIIDQIRIKTGFDVEVVDMPQEIFYKYIALFRAMDRNGLTQTREALLFVDISSGGLGITLYKDHKLKYQQNIHVGILRIKERFAKYQRESVYFHEALSQYIYSIIEPVEQALKHQKIRYLILAGTETRLLLKMLGREQSEELAYINPTDFKELYERVKSLNLPQLIQAFSLTEQKAEMVLPTIVLYGQILSLANIEEIVVPDDHFSDGLIALHVAEKTADPFLDVVEGQIESLAISLGEKYQYDQRHSHRVEKIALLLFDMLGKVHGLGRQERLMLQVAAILHDIGKFVSLRQHYFYSYRLIISSDILGFSEEDKAIIANVAHYHSKGTPSSVDAHFAVLSPERKVITAKLSAIIRLADAIDRSHRQKVDLETLELICKGDELLITADSGEDMSLEEWTFIDKSYFFEDVFGVKATLQRRRR